MFFSIGQLTDFLISDAGLSNQAKPQPSSGQVNFDEFVQSLTNQNKQTKGITGDLAKYISKTGTDSKSTSNNTALTDLLENGFDAAGLVGLVSQSYDKPMQSIPVAKYNTQLDAALATEVYDVVELEVADIKEYLTVSAKPITATIDIKELGAELSLEQLNKMPKAVAIDNLVSVEQESVKGQVNNVQTVDSANQMEKALSLKELALNFDTIKFDTRMLLNSDNNKIDITAFDKNGNEQDVSVNTSEVKSFIREKDQSPVIEIPNDNNDKDNISKAKLNNLNTGNYDRNEKTIEDKVIVDLKTLLNSKDTDEIKVVLKSVNNEPEKLSAAVILNEFKNNVKDSIKLKLESSSKDFALNDLSKSEQISKPAAENSSNEKHSDDSSDKKNQYAQNNSIKPHAVIQNQSTNQAIALNKETSSFDIASAQQTGLKDSGQLSSTESKSELYSLKDNKELIDSITNQVKAQLSANGTSTRLTVNLKPDYLGKIDIDFTFDKNKLEAVFRVEKNELRAILDSELPKLKNDFRIDSYRVEVNQESYRDDSQSQNGRSMFDRMADHNRPYRNFDSSDDELSNQNEYSESKNTSKQVRTGYGHGSNIDLLA